MSRAIIISVIMAFCFTACRRFLPSPYNMLLFYVLMVGVVAFVFKLPLRKSIVGVVFALLLTMLSSVTITMNLFIYTNIRASARDSLGLFLFITLTEVAFNLIYVLLAMRYEPQSIIFSEEKCQSPESKQESILTFVSWIIILQGIVSWALAFLFYIMNEGFCKTILRRQ